MITIYLNGKPLGFMPFQIDNHTPWLAYAHTLCKLEGKGSHYTYSKINGEEVIRIYTPAEQVFVTSRVIGRC